MKSLVKYLNDIHISQDDSVFQDDLKEVYEKIPKIDKGEVLGDTLQ